MGREPVSQKSILSSWFDYHESENGRSRADCIRMINERHGTRYTNTDIYRWLNNKKPVPDRILQMVNDDMKDLVGYVLRKHNVDITARQITAVSKDVVIPVPNKVEKK